MGETIPRSSILLITNEVTDETPEMVFSLFTDEVTTELESVSRTSGADGAKDATGDRGAAGKG